MSLELQSDKAVNFESAIRKIKTKALHPQSDRVMEKMQKKTGKYLSKVVTNHQRNWDKNLPLFLIVFKYAVNQSIKLDRHQPGYHLEER